MTNSENLNRLKLLQGGLSQPAWARLLGVHVNTVANALYEGKVGLKMARAIKLHHGITIDTWFQEESR